GMAAVFPKIVEMESEHGSLMRAFLSTLKRRNKPGGPSRPRPKGSVFSFPDGVETLPKRLAERLSIQYNVADAPVGKTPVTVLAVPAYRAADLLQHCHSELATLLRKVEYAPMVITAVSISDDSINAPLQGFGFLVPRNQGLHLLGSLFSSALFP